jgi:hypothetical protein
MSITVSPIKGTVGRGNQRCFLRVARYVFFQIGTSHMDANDGISWWLRMCLLVVRLIVRTAVWVGSTARPVD